MPGPEAERQPERVNSAERARGEEHPFEELIPIKRSLETAAPEPEDDAVAELNRTKLLKRMYAQFDAQREKTLRDATHARLAAADLATHELTRSIGKKEPKRRRLKKKIPIDTRMTEAATELETRVNNVYSWLEEQERLGKLENTERAKSYFSDARDKIDKAHQEFRKTVRGQYAETKRPFPWHADHFTPIDKVLDRYENLSEEKLYEVARAEGEELLAWAKRRKTERPWRAPTLTDVRNDREKGKQRRTAREADRNLKKTLSPKVAHEYFIARSYAEKARELNAAGAEPQPKPWSKLFGGKSLGRKRFPFKSGSIEVFESEMKNAVADMLDPETTAGWSKDHYRTYRREARDKIHLALREFSKQNRKKMGRLKRIISAEQPTFLDTFIPIGKELEGFFMPRRPFAEGSVEELEVGMGAARIEAAGAYPADLTQATHDIDAAIATFISRNPAAAAHFKQYKKRLKHYRSVHKNPPNKLHTISRGRLRKDELRSRRGMSVRGALTALGLLATGTAAPELSRINPERHIENAADAQRHVLLMGAISERGVHPTPQFPTPDAESYGRVIESTLSDSELSRQMDWDSYPNLNPEQRELVRHAFNSLDPAMLSALLLTDTSLSPESAGYLMEMGSYGVDSLVYDHFRGPDGKFDAPEGAYDAYHAIKPDARYRFRVPDSYPFKFSTPYEPFNDASDADLSKLGPRTLYQLKVIGDIAAHVRELHAGERSKSESTSRLEQNMSYLAFAQDAFRTEPTEETKQQYLDAAYGFIVEFIGTKNSGHLLKNLDTLLMDSMKSDRPIDSAKYTRTQTRK